MSATIAISIPLQPRHSALTRAEKKELNRLLNRWGDWIEKHGDFEGYPGVNILESFIGSDLGLPGHRILCLEMPPGVYATHQRVLRLPEDEKKAVWLWYVPVMQENGTTRSVRERCRIAGLLYDTTYRRVQRALMLIAGIAFNDCRRYLQASEK